MNQKPNSSPLSPGLLRPAALVLMVLGAVGFLAAAILYREQVLCQLGATLVVFVGLGLVLYARRQAGPDAQREPAGAPPRPGLKERVTPRAPGVDRRDVEPPLLEDDLLPQAESSNVGGLAGEVLAVYERKGAYVRVELSRPGRSIVRATLPDGMRTTVLVVESEEEVDLAEMRALFALVNEHASARGYLVARGAFSERGRAWADTRGLRLLGQGELWKLGLT